MSMKFIVKKMKKETMNSAIYFTKVTKQKLQVGKRKH